MQLIVSLTLLFLFESGAAAALPKERRVGKEKGMEVIRGDDASSSERLAKEMEAAEPLGTGPSHSRRRRRDFMSLRRTAGALPRNTITSKEPGVAPFTALLETKAGLAATAKAGYRAEVLEAGMRIESMVNSDDEDDEDDEDFNDDNDEENEGNNDGNNDNDENDDNDDENMNNENDRNEEDDTDDDDELKAGDEPAVSSLLATREGITFEPDVWNKDPVVVGSHNCYMYALNDVYQDVWDACEASRDKMEKKSGSKFRRVCRQHFHKPGYYFQNQVESAGKTDPWHRDSTTCNYLMPLIFSDNPDSIWRTQDQNGGTRQLTEQDECPNKDRYYMAAIVVDPHKGFHFYRKDHECKDPQNAGKTCWSHKPGILLATDKDASGDEMPSLKDADRSYGSLDYSQICGVFCVPFNSVGKTHSDNKK